MAFVWIYNNLFKTCELLLLFWSVFGVFEVNGLYFKPKIRESPEVILSPGDDFTIFCEGEKPLRWKFPAIPETIINTTTIFYENAAPMDRTKYKYGSKLYIEQMDFRLVGFYTCHEESEEYSEEFSSSIYLYVKDPEHPSVSEQGVEKVVASLYSNVTIPCRPTSPDVRVELSVYSGDTVPLNILLQGDLYYHYYHYDPQFGIITNNTVNVGYELYTCLYFGESVTFSKEIVVDIENHRDTLAAPFLEEMNGSHTVVGEKLVLRCTIRDEGEVEFKWKAPFSHGIVSPDKNYSRVTLEILTYQRQTKIMQLIINPATLADSGDYTCITTDYQDHVTNDTISVKIFDVDERVPISLSEMEGVYSITAKAGTENARWSIDVEGHPIPQLMWLDNHNESIPLGNSEKFFTNYTQKTALLVINELSISDFGYYTLEAKNKFEKKSLSVLLNVTDKPSLRIDLDPFHSVNQPSVVKCIVAAYPEPSIFWTFRPCLDSSCDDIPVPQMKTIPNGLTFTSYAQIKASKSGFVSCYANNSIGEDMATAGFYVTDIDNGFGVYEKEGTSIFGISDRDYIVANGDKMTFTCGASWSNYTGDLKWFYNSRPIESGDGYLISISNTSLSKKVSFTVDSATFKNGGKYSCLAHTVNQEPQFENITIMVKDPFAPNISQSNMDKDAEINFPERWEFFCRVSGLPRPKVTWLKNKKPFQPKEERIFLKDENRRLIFNKTTLDDEGEYTCVATNRVGEVSRSASINFKNKPKLQPYVYFIIGGCIIAVICSFIYIMIKARKERKLKRVLDQAGLTNFVNGNVEQINPDLGIDDQAELLPYHAKWEFPMEQLKLGKQLGSGAFGVVMKAIAKGIIEGEEETTVAVKMVKRNADYTYIKALASELKIMVHLGQHVNVVNLLGACTKNIAKRELYVIVEYCRFGNIQNYLLRHRDNFINQIDQKTGAIDTAIGQELLERTYSIASSRSNPHSPYKKFTSSPFSQSNGNILQNEMGDYRANSHYSAGTNQTVSTVVPNSAGEDQVLSNNSVQPNWRSNYRGDYKGNVRPIATQDLLCWAFQVSRGMEYLASRKVLHGDLAARNILLADNDVVKICDFGLAKSMYKDDNYKKRGDCPLPVKWMAVESIRDRVFSTQSDVWSYGVVLWELFSLARTPYPGMEANEILYNKLVDGYRMESPTYATTKVYKIMLDCWSPKPQDRPSFTKLTERIGNMLEDSVRRHYIDLNDPYLKMNTERIESGESDYLAMVSPPDFEKLSTPHDYMNDLPVPVTPDVPTPGYMTMTSNIFSPRPENNKSFDFAFSNNNRKQAELEGSGNELLPMLNTQESDCETPSACDSPNFVNSVSNPSYQVPPVIKEEDEEMNGESIVKTSDNYVNMPQNRSNLKLGEGMNQNGGVRIDPESKGSAHYVNCNTRVWESAI